MNNLGIAVTARAVSGFPLSIGTAIAMETLFPLMQDPYDKERKIPDQADLSQYDSIYLNLTTLFRNFISALEPGMFATVSVPDVVATLEEEISLINQLLSTHGPNCRPHYYYSTYSSLRSHIAGLTDKNVSLREPATELQKAYDALLQKTLKMMEEHTDTILKFDGALKPKDYDNSLIFTHQPYDLVDFRFFAKPELLESNTGHIKPRKDWNTKFHSMGTHDISMMPFHRKTLLVFGDRSLVRPAKMKLRETILDVAVKKNWHPLTSKDKINLDVELSTQDPYLVAMWRAL